MLFCHLLAACFGKRHPAQWVKIPFQRIMTNDQRMPGMAKVLVITGSHLFEGCVLDVHTAQDGLAHGP